MGPHGSSPCSVVVGDRAPRHGGSAAWAGRRARPAARRRPRQPHRPDRPARRVRAAGTSSTSSHYRTGRSATSPTSAIVVGAPCLIGCPRAARHRLSTAARGPAARPQARPRTGVQRPWLTSAPCPVPTASRASASTPRSPGSSASPAPRPPSWPPPARSRSTAAPVGKSDRVHGRRAGSRSSCPPPPRAGRRSSPSRCPGMRDRPRRRRHRRRRQAGRRRRAPERPAGPARPSSAGSPPPATASRPRAPPSARASCTGSTSAPRGLMVVAKTRARLHRAQARVQGAHGRQDLPRARAGPPRPAARHHRRARSAGTPATTTSSPSIADGKPTRHPLRGPRGVPRGLAARDPPGDRPHPPDPRALRRAAPPLRRRPHLRRRPDARRAARARPGSGCTPCGSASSTPAPGERVDVRAASYPEDLAARARALRGAETRRAAAPTAGVRHGPRGDVGRDAAGVATRPRRDGVHPTLDSRRCPTSAATTRSCTCTCTPSTPCSTAPPGIDDLFAEAARHGHAGPRDHRPRLRLRRLRLLEEGHRSTGVKPIIGVEAYVTPGTHRTDQTRVQLGRAAARDDVSGGGAYTHMTLLAENNRGHAQPVPDVLAGLAWRATTASRRHGPRAARRPTARASSPPPAARPARSRPGCGSGSTTRRVEAAAEFRDIFGNGELLRELMDHGLDIERRVHEGPAAARQATSSLPLVATNDLHYTTRRGRQGARGAAVRAVRLDPGRPEPVQVRRRRLLPQVRRARCAHLWRELPEACDNTLLIAERCEVVLHRGRGPVHAALPLPEGENEAVLVRQGGRDAACTQRYPGGIPDDVRKQADYETEVIIAHGLPRLLPRRRRLHQLGQGQRHPGRPGPWLRRRLDGAPTPCASPTSTRCSTA